MNTNYPYNLLSDIYGEHIDENHDLIVRGCYLDINALPGKMASLPDDLREYVRLRYEEGLSYTAIAKALDKPYTKVRRYEHKLSNATFSLLVHRDYGIVANTPWEDLLLFFPDEPGGIFLSFYEGTGDNLLHEDIEAGYVDYVNYETFCLSKDYGDNTLKELDGGMLMTKQYVKEMSLVTLIREICKEAGIEETLRWSVIVSR